MADHYFVLSEGVLGICTNKESIKFSYGIYPPATSREAYEACAVRVRLHIGDIPDFTTDRMNYGKYHYFYGEPYQDTLYYQRTFLFNSELRLKALGLLTDEPVIYANDVYYRYIQHRFMNLHSIGYILTDLISLLLLHRGYAPLHCSAIRKGDAVAVIFAPPNTGKTLTAMTACMEDGADFIAEDLAITDGKQVYSVPWTSTFRYYSNVDKSRTSRLLNAATQRIPVLELVGLKKPQPITDYISPQRILSRADVTHVIVLNRGDKAILDDISAEDMLRQISNLNRYEFNYYRAPLLTAYEYFNPDLAVRRGIEEETRILQTLIEQAKKSLVIRTRDPLEYRAMLLDVLSK